MVIDPSNSIHTSHMAANKAKPAAQREPKAEVSNDTGSDSASDNVSLSISGKTLAQVEASLAEAPDIDEAKVAVIKAAIANGSYKVDPDKIAASILAQESLY